MTRQLWKKRILEKTLGGVALDVFAVEPPISTKITEYDNVLVTPHIGGGTEESILAMGAAIAGLDKFYDASVFLEDQRL